MRVYSDEIAAAEQRGREDNADHAMCYVYGSKALAALIASERAERGTVDFLLAQKDEWLPEVERLRATVARVEALADEYECGGTCGSEDPEWVWCISCRLNAALDGAE